MTLKDKLIEKLMDTYPAGTRFPLVLAHGNIPRRNTVTKIVDTILTTLADEEPDEAMFKCAAKTFFDADDPRSFEGGVSKLTSQLVWKAMTAALRDSGDR